jgi:hypothetical protein
MAICFHWSYIYNYYNYLEPCALNAEFEHFIPRFNKISLLCETSLKEWIRGEDRVTLSKTVVVHKILNILCRMVKVKDHIEYLTIPTSSFSSSELSSSHHLGLHPFHNVIGFSKNSTYV